MGCCYLLSYCSGHKACCCPTGHEAYLGFLYVDYCYNNAVVHTFMHLLQGGSGPRHKPTATHNTRRNSTRKEDYKINSFITVKGRYASPSKVRMHHHQR